MNFLILIILIYSYLLNSNNDRQMEEVYEQMEKAIETIKGEENIGNYCG